MTQSPKTIRGRNSISLSRHRNKVWFVSGIAVLMSLVGFISSTLNPSIGLPLRPGLDFTGGTQIRIDRECSNECKNLTTANVSETLKDKAVLNGKDYQKLSGARIQLLDGYKSLLIRLPALSASESKSVIDSLVNIAGPFETGGQSVETIGPTLGAKLLKTTLISLFAAFSGVAIYISIRFDKEFSFYALLALLHDVLIVSGVFSWLGIILNVEVNSLFAVSLLTIAGYSVNDTVVIFDRIREINKQQSSMTYKEKIDLAVSATLI